MANHAPPNRHVWPCAIWLLADSTWKGKWMKTQTGPLVEARNDGPLLGNLLLAKPILIPPLATRGAGQHGEDLVEQEGPGWATGPSARHPEAGPLDPLAEVVRVQHVLEQPSLGNPVVLLDR